MNLPLLNTLAFITRHPLTRQNPTAAVLRFAKWQVRSRLQRDVEVKWIDGAKLIARRGMTGATGNIYCGLHEFADMAFVLHVLRPGDAFVDVGANIGSYTVLASKLCGARSLAIEPDPEAAAHLRRNIHANGIGGLVQIEEAAAGAARGVVRFTVGRDTVNQVTNDQAVLTREVPLTTLDELTSREAPVVIKMDVEGFEAEVLQGAQKTLRYPSLLAIETETANDAVDKQLTTAGFARWYYDPFSRRLSQSPFSIAANNALYARSVDMIRDRLASAPYRSFFGQRF